MTRDCCFPSVGLGYLRMIFNKRLLQGKFG